MDILVNFLAVVFCKAGNWIILAFAVINGAFYWRTNRAIKKADDMFHPKSDKVNGVSARMQWNPEEISKLKDMRRGLIIKYAWYANITAIFPLLGILGTVAALVTYSDVTMMENFMVALSTTLLGVLCAIFFKSLDAVLSGPMDVIIDNADYIIQNYERKEAQECGTREQETL